MRKKKDDRNNSAQLSIEILIMILMRLDLADCIRAGAVCSSWRAAWTEMVAHDIHSPSHRLPLLIVPRKNEIHRVFNLSDKKVHRLHLLQSCCTRFLGSFAGWLILMDKMTNRCFLLNVTSKECIHLPRQANVWNLAGHSSLEHFVSNSAGHRYAEHFWGRRLGIDAKAILSSDPTSGDCMVVIACSRNTLAFCRVGDTAWTALERETDQNHCISDITFYNGRVFIVRYIYELSIYELDPRTDSAEWKTLPRPEIEYPHNGRVLGTYLVESCGELLMVLRFFYRSRFITTFSIFKMDSNGSRWIKVESLGDQMLFLGYSKSISAKGLPGFKQNCIYFTKDIFTWNNDSGVFDLEDGSIWSFPSSIPSSIYYPARYKPIWVTPYPM